MKRVYKEASTHPVEGGFGISLDGKPLRTPAGAPLILPKAALAEAVAEEWRSQGGTVKPHTMPLMRLVSTAIDITTKRRDDVLAEILAYAGTDLLCYRAPHPQELAARQQEVWQPLIDWAMLRFDAPLTVTAGIVPVPQAEATLNAFLAAIGAYDPVMLTALQAATQALGSLVLGLALAEGHIDAETAFAASQLDETFQIEEWGEDEEQAERRAALRADIGATARLIEIARG